MNTSAKILLEKSVFSSDSFDVKEITISRNNKGPVKKHIAVTNGNVFVLPLTKHDELYLISEYRELCGKSMLGAIGGHIEKGEKPLDAAKRELEEEAGIQASQWEELTKIDLASSDFKIQQRIFLARDLVVGKANREEDEEITVIKMPLREAVEKVLTGEITHAG